MASGKKLTFKNTANVRNLFLKADGSSNAVNYKAPTKQANGATDIRSSLVERNYKENPNNYTWNSSHSYANTYNEPSQAQKTKYHKAQEKAKSLYGNVWHNAIAITESHNEEMNERAEQYNVNVVNLMAERFGDLEPDVAEEFLEHLESMNKLSSEYAAGKKTKTEYDEGAEIIFTDWHLNTEIPKEDLVKNYPDFKDLFFTNKRLGNNSLSVKSKALKNLLKTKRARNTERKSLIRNTIRKWRTLPINNGPRTSGAELLALAAKYGNNPANFSQVYNGVKRNKGKGMKFGTGSEVRERLSVNYAKMAEQEEEEEAAANAAALEAELTKYPDPKKLALNRRMAELNKKNKETKRPMLSLNMFKPPSP